MDEKKLVFEHVIRWRHPQFVILEGFFLGGFAAAFWLQLAYKKNCRDLLPGMALVFFFGEQIFCDVLPSFQAGPVFLIQRKLMNEVKKTKNRQRLEFSKSTSTKYPPNTVIAIEGVAVFLTIRSLGIYVFSDVYTTRKGWCDQDDMYIICIYIIYIYILIQVWHFKWYGGHIFNIRQPSYFWKGVAPFAATPEKNTSFLWGGSGHRWTNHY